jgi:hypothetical protein
MCTGGITMWVLREFDGDTDLFNDPLEEDDDLSNQPINDPSS